MMQPQDCHKDNQLNPSSMTAGSLCTHPVVRKHGELMDVTERTQSLALECAKHISHKYLCPLVEENLRKASCSYASPLLGPSQA